MAGRVALVTGATGGIGPAVVRGLAEDGATIVATARREDALLALKQEAGLPPERWLAQAADATDGAAMHELVTGATARFGSVDILVAVAGGWRGGTPVAQTEPETLEWLWRTNLVTAFNAIQAVLPGMIERRWGRIVTFSARSAQAGQARSGAYAASKAGLLALTQSVAAETRNLGITANVLLISTADTAANRASMPGADAGRWVAPAQIAAAIRFLCSDEAAAITGAAIPM